MNKNLFRIYQFIKYQRSNYSISPVKVCRELKESQYWSREETQNNQLDQLNKLLLFVRESSSYYKDKLKNINLPLKNLEDFNKLVPSIDKSSIFDNIETIRTKTFTNKYMHSTSGSSGDPLSVYISEKADIYRKASFMRFKDWWGIQPHEKSVLIWRYDRGNESLLLRIKTFLRARYDISVYKLDDFHVKKYYKYIEKFKPSYIRGYKSGMVEFARALEKNNLKFNKAKFKVAIVTAEILYTAERKLIERALNCKVANEYGSADAGLFAYECQEGNMHVNEEAVFLNVKENNAVHVTELFNDSMPLLNYKNNDEVEISNEKCSCGRTSRLIKKVKGRTSGYILKPDGTKVNQGILIDFFTHLSELRPNSLRKFKVYQTKNNFRIEIIPLENFDVFCQEYLVKKIHKGISEDINVNFKLVNNIAREKSGKLVYFVREE